MGKISVLIMYSRTKVRISHHKKHDVTDPLFDVLDDCELEVFCMRIRNKDCRMK